MTARELLAALKAGSIEVWLEGDRLRYRAPKGALTPELQEAIRRLKPELIPLLPSGPNPTAPVLSLGMSPGHASPLSAGQRRLWFFEELQPGTGVFNVPFSIRLDGPLEVPALEAALRALLDRHDVLRTRFENVDGEPRQTAEAGVTIPLKQVDLTGAGEADQRAACARLASEIALAPFDLARAPLIRCTLVRLADRQHILMVCAHHIVCDGTSIGIVVRDLAALYGSAREGAPPVLPALPVRYRDFAAWQEAVLNSPERDMHLRYWRGRLAGDLTPLTLPLDRARPAVQTYSGESCATVIDEALTAELKALARASGATLFMVLLSAFKVLLGRQSGQSDLIVGTPVAGRTRAELEPLVGMFINTVPVRTGLRPDTLFREYVSEVREAALEAYEHQDLPFEQIVGDLQPVRDLSRPPIFQALFNMFGGGVQADLTAGGVHFQVEAGSELSSKFDLTLYATARHSQIEVSLLYNPDLFGAARAEEMLRQFQHLLQQVAHAPSTPIGDLTLVTADARPLLPDPTVPLEPGWPGAIVARLREHARVSGGAVAVRDSLQGLTYGDLDERSDRLASWLRSRGIQPGALVALYAHREANLVVAIAGVMKAGAAFLLLDPAQPARRTEECLAAARPEAWIQFSQAGAPDASVVARVREICICELTMPAVGLPEAVSACRGGVPELALHPDDRAYVAFTSGSTGGVKGIVGTHRPLSHFVDWHARQSGLDSRDRFSLLSGLAHDPLLRDIFTPLFIGATLVVPDPAKIQEPGWLAEWMRDQRISVAHLTPAMAELLLIEGHSGRRSIPELAHMFLAGEVLQTQLVARLRDAAPNASCVNFYGATETPQAMGWNVADASIGGKTEAPNRRESVPVGSGIEGVQLLVLNDARQLSGVGELGEIHIRTPYLAAGYLNDPALTAERFIINPFTGTPGDRVYRTGDFGRYLPDGRVEFAGRRDLQVKIRGFRVELEAIEAAIREHPDVEAAVVTTKVQDGGEPRIVAYVKWRRAASPEPDLGVFLRARLPDYMVPAAFAMLESVPLTPNGKVNRRALPDLDLVQTRPADRSAPETETEKALAAIWTELLGVREVGRDDEFFALGGHSLAAARLISRIDKGLSARLPLRTVFEAPSLRALAARIDAGRLPEATGPRRPQLVAVPRTGVLPLSFAQERLWFLQQLLPGSSAYHMAAAARLTGPLDPEAFRAAWMTIGRRHEALRTRIRQKGGQPFVEIADEPLLDYTELDLRSSPGSQGTAEALGRIRELVERPFDLEEGPLVRVLLARLGEHTHVHGVALHHIIADHWSIAPLTRDLAEAYESLASGRDPQLPPLRVQYVDYTAWQRAVLDEQELARQLAFWKTTLEGLEPLELPFDRARPASGLYRGARAAVPIPEATLAAVRALSQTEGVTLFMALLAAFKVLLHRYTGRRDLAVGSPVSNRAHVDLEPVVGMFVNMLVLRTDLSGSLTGRELLRRVRDTALDAYAHQDFPFERLVSELRVARDVSQPPLVQVAFNVQNAPMERQFIEGVHLEPLPVERTSTQFDLSLAIEPEVTRTITAEYSSELFDAATVHRMLAHYVRLIEAMAASPDAPIAALPMLSEAEHREVVVACNETAREYPNDVPITALLSRTAAAVPDKVALVCGSERLTYSELEWRACWLANHLQQYGAERDVPVAVCLERSPQLAVALLGVLKAGAAYVPLDPAFPRERLSFMIRDAGAPIIVTAGGAADDLDAGPAVTVDLDQCWATMTEEHGTQSAAAGNDLAYVIYTSGSTGLPKGVKIPHCALVNFLCSMRERPGLGRDDVLLSVTTPSFDIFGLELYLPLLAGATVVLATSDETTDGARLAELVEERGVTVMQATPATWRLMINAGWEGSRGLRVLCGGEALSRELADQLLKRAASVWNLYGPTETTIWSALDEVAAGPAPITIGRPIANTELLILDEHLQPVPTGVPGEIFIGGGGLARGYLNRPELDAEKFVDHPFRRTSGARLYRTGDAGRRLADGRVECLGRSDHQVKVRGFRIELGEIESLLDRHEAVRQSVASVYDDGSGDRRLVAYVSFQPGEELTASDLRRYARQHLPEYMVPSLFVVMDRIPLTPNGKVNRKALPPPIAAARGRATRVAPRTSMEQTVAEVWMEVLGVKEVGVHDNFFDVGGHSLLSMQAIAKLERRVGVRLNPTRFIMDTLEQISLAYEDMAARAGVSAAVGGQVATEAGRA